VLHFGTACYAYAPVTTSPTVGTHVALDVNDEGRVALREQLGPGVVRLEGRLAAIEGNDLVLDASRVTQLRGLPLRSTACGSVSASGSSSAWMSGGSRPSHRYRDWLRRRVCRGVLCHEGFHGARHTAEQQPGEPPVNERRSPDVARSVGARPRLCGWRVRRRLVADDRRARCGDRVDGQRTSRRRPAGASPVRRLGIRSVRNHRCVRHARHGSDVHLAQAAAGARWRSDQL
jgi:hypothetical protein